MASGILGPGMMSAQADLQQARESQLLEQMQSAGADPTGQREKIEKGAKEFEALLLSGWLQQAEQSLATVPGADEDEDAAGKDTMMSLGVQTLATSLAGSGGIGIGAMIEKAMLSMAQKSQSPAENPDPKQHIPLNSSHGNADRMAVLRKGPA